MTGDCPRVDIEAASRRRSDDNSYNLTLIKRALFRGESNIISRNRMQSENH